MLKNIVNFKEYVVQFEKTGAEERCYVLCWEGDFLKKVCVACQSLQLPMPDAELVPMARIMCSLGTKQLEEVLLQSFRQAHQDVFGMLEVVTAVEYVVLRLKSVVHEDWLEDKPCLKKCILAGVVNFVDLRTVLTDLIELWPTFRTYIRYTGHPHLKEVADRVSILEFLMWGGCCIVCLGWGLYSVVVCFSCETPTSS